MFPIDEKQEFVPFKRDRTNSDQFDPLAYSTVNEIKQELDKPSTQQVTSFTEGMVYMLSLIHI